MADVGLDFAAHFRDQALRGHGDRLGDGESRDALNDSGCQNRENQRKQKLKLLFRDDVVDQVFR